MGPPMTSWRDPEIPTSGSPQQCRQKMQIFASALNRATCGQGDSQMRAPAGRRSWPISGPRFRRRPSLKRAAETSENAPPEPSRPPPYDILTGSRNSDFRISPTMSPEIADFRVGPKSGDVWAGRLSNAGPRRSAQLVDFRTPFSPETPSKTRDGDVRKRAAGTQ